MNICFAAAAAKSLQPCPTLCDPIDGSPPGSSVHGIFQARVLEWGTIAFSTGQPRRGNIRGAATDIQKILKHRNYWKLSPRI